MTVRKLTVENTIKDYTNENGFSWGLNTVMQSIAPGAIYDVTAVGGEFIVNKWESTLPKPTSEEIKIEYIRQETIAECVKYFKKQYEKYSGGELEQYSHGAHEIKELTPGSVIMMPSYVYHRVKPMISGQRKTLAIFIQGSKFIQITD